MISKDKYKELLDKTVELEKIKNTVFKLQCDLKDKADIIKGLHSKIRQYENEKNIEMAKKNREKFYDENAKV